LRARTIIYAFFKKHRLLANEGFLPYANLHFLPLAREQPNKPFCMKKFISVLPFGLLLAAMSVAQGTHVIFVSPTGNDTYTGSITKPFATLERAKLAARAARKLNKLDTCIVYLRGGVYALPQSLILDSTDAGTKKAPVIYTAYKKEEVHINGSMSIPVHKATLVSDPKILERLVSEARTHILQVNLKQAGVNNYGQFRPRGFARPYEPSAMELFVNGKAMKLSRWPNDSLVKMGKVLDRGSVPRDGDTTNRGGTFTFDEARPQRWSMAEDIWISGFFCYGYADDAVKIANLDFNVV
jgi:hypothetical protein